MTITNVTAPITRANPKKLFHPNGSPKCNIPTKVATTGSIDPKIDVMVDPAYLTAETKANPERTVANKANPIRLNHDIAFGTISIPVVKYENTEKINVPKSIT